MHRMRDAMPITHHFFIIHQLANEGLLLKMPGSPLEVPISSDEFEETLVCVRTITVCFIICQQTNECFPIGVVCE
eukprot:10734174-Ditylum_brightwellii.AAC.1